MPKKLIARHLLHKDISGIKQRVNSQVARLFINIIKEGKEEELKGSKLKFLVELIKREPEKYLIRGIKRAIKSHKQNHYKLEERLYELFIYEMTIKTMYTSDNLEYMNWISNMEKYKWLIGVYGIKHSLLFISKISPRLIRHLNKEVMDIIIESDIKSKECESLYESYKGIFSF